MWWLLCGVAGFLGLLGGLAVSTPASVLPLAISAGTFGAVVSASCQLTFGAWPESGVGRAIGRSAWGGVLAALGFVLPLLVLGPVWLFGMLLLAVTSPPSVRWCRSHIRAHAFLVSPEGMEPEGVEPELWAAWVTSGRALKHPLSVGDASVLVEIRQQVLDELVAQNSALPAHLWGADSTPRSARSHGTECA